VSADLLVLVGEPKFVGLPDTIVHLRNVLGTEELTVLRTHFISHSADDCNTTDTNHH